MIYKKILFTFLFLILGIFFNTSGTLGNAKKDEYITFTLMNNEKLVINKKRYKEASFFSNRIDNNRWTLSETDRILESIKGTWKPDKYIGFVPENLYYPDLFDYVETLDEDYRENMYKEYDAKVSAAKEKIPDIYFAIKEHNGEDTDANYIFVNDHQESPVDITFSTEQRVDYFPSRAEETAISQDFLVEYPVMYIKFFQRSTREKETISLLPLDYEGATLVISSDHQFYYLFDGAFYSLTKIA